MVQIDTAYWQTHLLAQAQCAGIKVESSMVSLPTGLQQAINQACLVMTRDTRHALAPFYRRAIYSALDKATGGCGQEAQARLSQIAAQRVLPIWQSECPDDNLPLHLLRLAEGILTGTVDRIAASTAADNAWERLERLGIEAMVTDRCFSAGAAAREALVAALGREAFDAILISTNDTDADLDPWCSDTAKWAVAAWAGSTWGPEFDLSKQQEFWHWWLTFAVPQAWRSSIDR